MGGGLIDFVAKNWIPMFKNHFGTIIIQIVIGLIFTAIYFIVFKLVIEKFNIMTPGREIDNEIKLYSREDYKEKKSGAKLESSASERYREQAAIFLEAVGGRDNVVKVNNCATRLRLTVSDVNLVQEDAAFKAGKAHGVVRNGDALQIIVGLDVPQVREQFELLMQMYN